MKRLTNKIIITVFTFIIGIAVVIWFSKAPSEMIADPNIYSVGLCELVSSNRYDGKIVRVQAVHYQGADSSGFANEPNCSNRTQMATVCIAGDEACGKIFEQMNAAKSIRAKVDIIGRYKANSINQEFSQSKHLHLFEILELKSIEDFNEP